MRNTRAGPARTLALARRMSVGVAASSPGPGECPRPCEQRWTRNSRYEPWLSGLAMCLAAF